MTIHYHGTPLTPRAELLRLAGRFFCVSFARPDDVEVVHEIGQGVMLDNGAFSAWRQGIEIDWLDYYRWCEHWLAWWTTWAVIPDVIGGDAEANDQLLTEWPHGDRGAPVWHPHEPIARLVRLAADFSRVCIGGSSDYPNMRAPAWRARIHDALDQLCGAGPPPCQLHLLRGMQFAGSELPLASVDSSSVARNHAGSHRAPRQDVVAMVEKRDAQQCPARWTPTAAQLSLTA